MKTYNAKYIIKINRQEFEKELEVQAEDRKKAIESVRQYAQQKLGRHAFRIEVKEAK